jgi:hypothetical protein
MTFLLSEFNSGSGTALSGWEKAGFKIEWLCEVNGPARRIQRANGRKCYSLEPIFRKNVDFAVFYVNSNNKKIKKAFDMINEDLPPAFLIESDFPLNNKIVSKYDLISFCLNSAWFFNAHTRIKFYLIGILMNRNPNADSLLNLQDSILKHKKSLPNSVESLIPEIHSNIIVTPFNKNSRAVHSSSRPLPELHSRSGKSLGKYWPHTSDSALLSESKILRNDQVSKICGLNNFIKPSSVSRDLWFKWLGNGLDPGLSNLIGCEILKILNSGNSFVNRKPNLVNIKHDKKIISRTSKISLLCKTENTDEIIQWCDKMNVKLELSPSILIEYCIGFSENTDICFNELCGFTLPKNCVVRIKTRKNQTNKLDDVTWFYDGILFRSKKKLKDLIDKDTCDSM